MSALGSILLALTVLGTVASLCAIVPLVRRVRELESKAQADTLVRRYLELQATVSASLPPLRRVSSAEALAAILPTDGGRS